MAHGCADGLPRYGLTACYFHLKASALNGGFGRLTDEEREFVGVGIPQEYVPSGNSDDWTSLLANARQTLGMNDPGQERLRFLG